METLRITKAMLADDGTYNGPSVENCAELRGGTVAFGTLVTPPAVPVQQSGEEVTHG